MFQLGACALQLLLQADQVVSSLKGLLLAVGTALFLPLEGLVCGLLGGAGGLELFLELYDVALALEGLFAGAADLFLP